MSIKQVKVTIGFLRQFQPLLDTMYFIVYWAH